MLKKRKGCFMVLCMFMMLFVILGVKAEAASAKTKALKAYGKMLSKEQVAWDANYKVPSAQCQFAVVYIDNDKIPELVLYNNVVPHMAGYGRVFTYKNGKIRRVGEVDLDGGKLYYYKKKGVVISTYVMGGVFDNYRKLTNGKIVHKLQKGRQLSDNKTKYYNADNREITKSKFNKELKKLVGSKKKTAVKFHKNTKANRKKYCK